MKKIFIICDGMDFEYTNAHLDELPFISEMKKKGTFSPLQSVVPADSVPSWSTIYTGLNPCEHGVLDAIDYLDAKNNLKGDYSWLQGKVFWDKISSSGKKVLVVNPFMAFPAWDLNGLMISGAVFEGGELSISDESKCEGIKMPEMGGITDYPKHREMNDFFQKTLRTTQEQFEVFEQLLKKDSYDFAFLGILTLDRMQHFLWRYTDSTDVTYVKKSNLHNSILETYKLIDTKIGEIYNKYKDEFEILVISDHGHGKRCEKTFYINRFLIENGFIPNKSLKKRFIEFGKNTYLSFLYTFHIVSPGINTLKKISVLRKLKNADYGEKKTNTAKISVPNFDGVNPFGGIRVNKDMFDSTDDFIETKKSIINKLLLLEDHGKRVVEWAKLKEDIYNGSKSDFYPEIIYKLDNNYGVERGLFGKRKFGKSYFHEIISGGHRWYGVNISSESNDMKSVLDVFDYIMRDYQ